MFTGLIEEVGLINFIRPYGGGKLISVVAKEILKDIKIDDSVAINGVCQTVIGYNRNTFEVVAVEETLQKTTLGKLVSSRKVNLERAVRADSRLGGHFVQGHVDCVGSVAKIEKLRTAINLWISFPNEYQKLVVPTGSAAIEGVSLTSARVEGDKLMCAVIPHTADNTILGELRPGSEVNIEFDVIGKYVNKVMSLSKS